MPTLREVVSALKDSGLDWVAEDAERLGRFAEDFATFASGEVAGYAVEVFPGAFMLNVFLDALIVLGRDVTLVAEVEGEDVVLRVDNIELHIPQIDCIEFAEFRGKRLAKVCTEDSPDADNVKGRAVRYWKQHVNAGKAVLLIVRPTWNIIHVEILDDLSDGVEVIKRVGIHINI